MAATENLTVTAPLVVARMGDGTYVHVYEGSPLPDGIDPEQRKQLVDTGMVQGGSQAASADSDPADDDDGRPAGNASRDDWAAYAVAQGHSEEELAELGRDEIRALFD